VNFLHEHKQGVKYKLTRTKMSTSFGEW